MTALQDWLSPAAPGCLYLLAVVAQALGWLFGSYSRF